MQALSFLSSTEINSVPEDYRSDERIFFLRIETQLYVDRNFSAGDLLIVERRDRLGERDIVVVRRGDGQLALRSGEAIQALGEMLALLPPSVEPPEEKEPGDKILGVVVGVMKKF